MVRRVTIIFFVSPARPLASLKRQPNSVDTAARWQNSNACGGSLVHRRTSALSRTKQFGRQHPVKSSYPPGSRSRRSRHGANAADYADHLTSGTAFGIAGRRPLFRYIRWLLETSCCGGSQPLVDVVAVARSVPMSRDAVRRTTPVEPPVVEAVAAFGRGVPGVPLPGTSSLT